MTLTAEYDAFVASKGQHAAFAGIPDADVSGFGLFDFQERLASWALARGRACLFVDTGLGKTAMQLVWAAKVPGRVLILAPLAVAKQSEAEAIKFGVEGAGYARTQAEADAAGTQIVLTNYERLHQFDPSAYQGVVLDESSIIKSFSGKIRTQVIDAFARTPYRLACSATPAPNDHMELGNHSEFVGAMTRGEMLSTYFVHDGGSTASWRLKGHAVRDFWSWVCSWAAFVRCPSEIGYDGSRFELPELTEQAVIIPTPEGFTSGDMFHTRLTLQERRGARRMSIEGRCERAAELVAAEPDEPWLIWCELNDESKMMSTLLKDRGAVEVKGPDSAEHKESALLGFARGDIPILVTKPKICGFGMNFQKAARMIFVGVNDSWESRYQAVRRCWRFGQTRPVHVYYVMSNAETTIHANVARKDNQNEEAHAIMRDATQAELTDTAPDRPAVARKPLVTGDGWHMFHGDCVQLLAGQPEDSIDISVFSPPFASLYTYTDDEYDMGNTQDLAEFMEQFSFLAAQLLRVLKPGRVVAIHCMNIPAMKERDGYIGLKDFRGDLLRCFEGAGFIYHSEVCIEKDPVTQMQRTKALGLLHKQIRKDSTMCRMGLPDYVIAVRKPGTNLEPVAHTKDEFPVALWQKWANPIWNDINPSDTLQKTSAREHEDERHICPLQLEVIFRCCALWSNPGDLVLSPFAGIGSEGFQAIKMGRRFLGMELKGSYYDQACKNLHRAENEKKQLTLF